VPGMLDDYAFLIWGLLELYEASFNADCLKTALELADNIIDHFHDEKDGGFYFAADDGEEILFSKRTATTGRFPRATP